MNSKTKYNRVFIGSGLLLLVSTFGLALTGCGKKEEVVTVELIRPVKMVQLQSGGLTKMVELPGQIFPARQANMAFEVPGLMTDILVEEGQKVEVGHLLAKLDPRDYEAIRNAAAAQAHAAELEASRAQSLYDRQATSKQRLDLSISNFTVAQAAFDRAEKAYNDTFLKAPISGIVAKVFVEDIVNVGAKQNILIIQDLSSLKVKVNVPETMGLLAKPGLSLEERTSRSNPTVYLTALSDRGFPARLIEVSSMADFASRTYEVTLEFDPPGDLNILPGMTAKLVVNLTDVISIENSSYVVPSQAVIADESGGAFVWVVDSSSNTVSKQSVETGNLAGSEIEVISDGLSDGDWVATSGVHQLRQGNRVSKFEN